MVLSCWSGLNQNRPTPPFVQSSIGSPLTSFSPSPQYFSVDPVGASIMEIHTFNKDREKVRVGVETIAK